MGGRVGRDVRRRRPPSDRKLAHLDLVAQILRSKIVHAKQLRYEYQFAPLVPSAKGDRLVHIRRWSFDIAFPDRQFYVEVEGGMFAGGRHGGQRSVVRDLEKRNAATCLCWRGVHVTPSQVKSGEALKIVRALFGGPLEL